MIQLSGISHSPLYSASFTKLKTSKPLEKIIFSNFINSVLVLLFFFTSLCANPTEVFENANLGSDSSSAISIEETQIENEPTPTKVLYLNYEYIPSRVLNGEVFKVTLRTLPIIKDFTDITYELTQSEGLKLLSTVPLREVGSKYYYDTFYFLATEQKVKLPNFTATLMHQGDKLYQSTMLLGEELNVISLNPKSNFANIIASSFELVEYKTTNFDASHNIVVFVAMATNSNITALKLNNVYKQGIESATESYFDSKITYYAIIDKNVQNLSFSYFNLTKNRFININIPIIVSEDTVTTQSDLKPIDQSQQEIKIAIAAAVGILGFLLFLWRKRYIYIFLTIVPISYIVYVEVPSKDVCIEQNTNIYLLPIENGTIFEKAHSSYHLRKEGEIRGWVKVQLKNKKIGWVKNEDLCKN